MMDEHKIFIFISQFSGIKYKLFVKTFPCIFQVYENDEQAICACYVMARHITLQCGVISLAMQYI